MSKVTKATLVALFVCGVVVGWGSFWRIAQAPGVVRASGASKPLVVVFMGDIMLDRDVARAAAARGASALFASTTDLLAGSDLRIANLEGTITTNPSIAQQNSNILRFTFDPLVA